jgi:hypothetical protein
VPLCIAAAIAGCGSSKTEVKVGAKSGAVPADKEPISGYVNRLEAAMASIQAGKCAPVNDFNKRSGFQLFCNAKGKKAYKDFKVLGTETFGTGGVVEFRDAEVQKLPRQKPTPGVKTKGGQQVGVITVALDADGRYEATGPVAPILPGSVIGTKPVSWSGADSNAVTFLESVRDRDCATFFKYSITPRGLPQKAACRQGLDQAYAELHKQLGSGKKADLFRQGGNAQFYFYGLRTGSQFRTLVIGKNPPPGPTFLAFGTFRATK